MASKINKKYSADIKGLISIDGDKISITIEDYDEEINLAEFILDFADKPNVKIGIAYGEEIV